MADALEFVQNVIRLALVKITKLNPERIVREFQNAPTPGQSLINYDVSEYEKLGQIDEKTTDPESGIISQRKNRQWMIDINSYGKSAKSLMIKIMDGFESTGIQQFLSAANLAYRNISSVSVLTAIENNRNLERAFTELTIGTLQIDKEDLGFFEKVEFSLGVSNEAATSPFVPDTIIDLILKLPEPPPNFPCLIKELGIAIEQLIQTEDGLFIVTESGQYITLGDFVVSPSTPTPELTIYNIVYQSDKNGVSGDYSVFFIDSNGLNDDVLVASDPGNTRKEYPVINKLNTQFAYCHFQINQGAYSIFVDTFPTPTSPTNILNGFLVGGNFRFPIMPAFSNDGLFIVFASAPVSTSNFGIFKIEISTTTITNISLYTTTAKVNPSWSPDDSTIIFEEGGNIYSIASDGTGSPVNLTSVGSPGTNFTPGFTSDGTKIIFVSTRTGTAQLHIMNANGTGQVILLASGLPDFDFSMAWSDRGIFTRDNSGDFALHQVEITGNNPTLVIDSTGDDELHGHGGIFVS